MYWKFGLWLLNVPGVFICHIEISTTITFAGFGLNDSPIALAAYILEKFSTWTNKNYKDMPGNALYFYNRICISIYFGCPRLILEIIFLDLLTYCDGRIYN